MKSLSYLDKYRVDMFSSYGDEYNGAFRFKINGSPVMVIASNGGGWDHVSVSHANRIPSWETMSKVKEMFFNYDEVAIEIHPAKEDYINFHKYCLHLWRPQHETIPMPPKCFV